MALWDSQAESAVQSSLRRAKIQALGDWRQEMDARREWYDGDQEAQIGSVLSEDAPETSLEIREIAFGFARKVVDETAQVYWMRPHRDLMDGDEVLPSDHPLVAHFNSIQDGANIDTVMRYVDRMTRLYMCEYVWVQYDAAADKIRLHAIDPQHLYVEQDPDAPGSIAAARAVFFPLTGRAESASATSEDKCTWMGISQDEWMRFRGDVSDSSLSIDEELDGGDNPYGRIPLVGYYDTNPMGALFPTGNYNVVQNNKILSLMFSHAYELITMQAHGQPVIRSAFSYSKIPIGARRAFQLRGENDDFFFASPNAKISEVIDTIEWTAKAFSAIYSLSPNVFSTVKQELSGYAMRLDNLPLVRLNTERQEMFSQWDADLFSCIVVVNNAHSTPKFPDSITQAVRYEPLDFPFDPESEWRRDKDMVNMGVKSPVDIIMSLNPDMGREQAIDLFEQNLADKRRLLGQEEGEKKKQRRFSVRLKRRDDEDEKKQDEEEQDDESGSDRSA